MSRTTVRIIAFAVGISILAACSAPAVPVGPVTVEATLNAEPGSEAAIAAFYFMADMSLMTTTQASGVISPSPGIYLGPASPVDADATVHLVLPDPADLPAGVLGPAEGFVMVPATPPSVCPTTASVPNAKVSAVLFQGIESYPMVVLLTGGGLATSYTSDKKLDFSSPPTQLDAMRFVTWLYASNDVDVKTATGGCANGTDPTVVVDRAFRTALPRL